MPPTNHPFVEEINLNGQDCCRLCADVLDDDDRFDHPDTVLCFECRELEREMYYVFNS